MKRKKTIYSIAAGLLCFTFISTSSTFANNIGNETVNFNNVLPDKSSIVTLEHVNKLKEFNTVKDENEQKKLIHNYLKGLNTKELLETAAEIQSISDGFFQDVLIIVPYLVGKWEKGVDEEAYEILSDTTYNPEFRAFTLDLMTTNAIKENTLKEHKFQNEIAKAIKNKEENAVYRSYALKKLNENFPTDKIDLENIVFDKAEDSDVRGSAITAMRRTGDNNYKKVLNEVLSSKENDNQILRYTVVSAAKSGDLKEYISDVKSLIKQKNNEELTSTFIYALGNKANKESIKTIVDLYSPNHKDIVKFSLRSNEKTILEMFNSEDTKDIEAALYATLYGNITTAIPLLENLSNYEELGELVNKVKGSLDYSDSIDPKIQEKWEDR